MKILITGGAGFIASHVADMMVSQGHEVTILDNLRSGSVANLNPKAVFLERDLREPGLGRLLEGIRPEVILHFAAQIDVRVSCRYPVLDAEENILATLRLLEAGTASGLRHFVFASSGGAIYGEASGPQRETDPEVPINPYGVAKLAVDKYLHAYAVQRGLKACSLRFSNVYGPRQGAKGEAGVVAVFCKRLRAGEAPVINGDGSQTRDFIFVEDLAAAALRVVQQESTGVINLGTGRETSILALAEGLCREAGMDPARIAFGQGIPGEQRRSVLDPAKAGRELGWTPGTSLQEGLGKTCQWFLARQEEA